MTRSASEDLYEEAFGSPDQEEHDGRGQPDPSLKRLDRRDVELDYWRFGGIYFPATMVRLGKGWMVALQALLLVAMAVLGVLGVRLLAIALLPVLIVLFIYEYTSLDQWTADYNARVAARRREADERRES